MRKDIFEQVFVGLMDGKTRILVTHAVDFIHLADHVIIMKNGRIEAQGSYEKLANHPYMKEVQEIHTKNKREIQEADLYSTIVEEVPFLARAKTTMDNSSYNPLNQLHLVRMSSMTSQGRKIARRVHQTSQSSKSKSTRTVSQAGDEMDEAELDDKLETFQGARREVDASTSKVIGKLLIDEADENVEPDQSTYKKIFKMIGGPIPILGFAIFVLVKKYTNIYTEKINAEYANEDPEQQANEQLAYLRKSGLFTVLCVFMGTFNSLMMRWVGRRIGQGIFKETLRKVLLAPVNTFFDVTPVGKILKIFQEEINIFNEGLLSPFEYMSDSVSHVVVVSSFMFALGFWETLAGFTVLALLLQRVVPYYLSSDNQLQKIGATLWSPIHSYFYECMRGTTVIRAFNEEESIMKKQHDLLDKTTTHFIANHSCWCWYNLRMYYISKLFYIIALGLIAKNRTTADTIALVLLFNWSRDMG